MSAEGFSATPNWLYRDTDVSLYALVVYGALASHTGPGGVRPSQSTLAREARCSERQVRNALAELRELGVVEVVRRRRGGDGRSTTLTNGYVLHPHGLLADDEEAIEVPAPDAASSEVPAGDADSSPKLPAHSDEATGTQQQVIPLIEEEPVKKNPGVVDELDGIPKGTRGAMPFPRPFIVTAHMREWAAGSAPSVNLDVITAEFVAYWREGEGKGKKRKNWPLTWMNRMRSVHERNLERGWKPTNDDDRKVIRGGRVVA